MLSFCLSSFFFFWWMNLTLIHIKSCYWSCLFLGLGRVKGLSEGWRSSVFEKLNRNELLFLSSSHLNAERGTHWLSSPDKCKWLPVWEVTSCSFSLDSYSVSRFVLVGFLLIYHAVKKQKFIFLQRKNNTQTRCGFLFFENNRWTKLDNQKRKGKIFFN